MKNQSPRYTKRRMFGLVAGPALFCIMLAVPAPAGMSPQAQKTAALALLMATWWLCESIPIAATSLLPVALMPLLGIMHTKKAAAPYASHLIFLFMGGFIIGLSMQRWNLHRRIAMHIVRAVGFSPKRLILGFMIATAGLSAFVSNTATTIMMMPIGTAIIVHVIEEAKRQGRRTVRPENFPFALNLMLGIAYAASIGGMATLIGTPPNTVLAGFLQKTYGFEITFFRWFLVGAPLACVMLPLCWLWLTFVANPVSLQRIPGGRDLIGRELRTLGPMSPGERWTALVFCLTAVCWMLRPRIGFLFPDPALVTDGAIAVAGALLLFLIPVNLKKSEFVMNWQWAARLPWGILVLFGGGLSLASGFTATGLADWIGAQAALLDQAPVVVLLVAVVVLIVFLTELTSNTATAAMSMPVLAAVALGIGQNPLLLLAPAAIAASCAFMLPVATPPNAIVFASGYVDIPRMAKSGFGLNIIAITVVTLWAYMLMVPLFEIVLNRLPSWAVTFSG